MESKIAAAIRMELQPVALVWADDKPPEAIEFAPGKQGCIMSLLSAAAKGKTAAAGRETFGCVGGATGLGFGRQFQNFPGGEECFCRFLSSGNAGTQPGEAIGRRLAAAGASMAEDFLHGERFMKTPELTARFVECLPVTDIPAQYVVFKPLADVDLDRDDLRSVTFLVNPDQFSALVVLANYGRGHNENVLLPFAAGCHVIGIYTYREMDEENPRAVAGLIDLSARRAVRRQLGQDVMSFSVARPMFLEMEQNVAGSFLERPTWQSLLDDFD